MTSEKFALLAWQSAIVVLLALLAGIGVWIILGAVASRFSSESTTRSLLLRLRVPSLVAWGFVAIYVVSTYLPLTQAARHRIEISLVVGATFLGAFVLARVVSKALDWYLRVLRTEEQVTALQLIRRVLLIAVWAVAGLIVLDLSGFKVGPLLASLGIVGIAVAVSMQDMLSGLFAGLYIALARPFVVKEYIRVDPITEGFVEQIGIRNTVLRSRFGEQRYIVPNVNLIRSSVMALPTTVHEVSVRAKAATGTDTNALEQACHAAARALEGRDEGFEPVFRVLDLPAGALDFIVTVRFSEPADPLLLEHRLRCALYARLKERSIALA